MEITRLDKFINLLTLDKNEKVKARCNNCGRGIFNLDGDWAKNGLCVYCWELVEKMKEYMDKNG